MITHDLTCEDLAGGVAIEGVTSVDFESEELPRLKFRFRLLDGSGLVYYEGLSSDASSQAAFAPLDDFGQGYAGCAFIEYLENGKWVTL